MKELLGSLELNRIYQLECLEGMKLIPDGSIDMILCDLPYGTTACKWDTIIPLEPLWEQYKRIINANGAIVLTAAQPFTTKLINSNIDWFKYTWVWNKEIAGAFALAKYRPMIIHEDICVFSKEKTNYFPIMEDANPKNIRPVNKGSKASEATPVASGVAKSDPNYNPKKRYPKSILTYSKYMAECNQVNRVHPTQKPVALFEYLINTYTKENDIILDNCMGSGTTAVAAIKNNRKFIGFETESEYIEIANQRIESTYDKLVDKKLLDDKDCEK